MTRIGVVLPTRGLVLEGGSPDFGRILTLAREAEAIGVDSVWVGDSLTAKPRLEPLSVLAAVAGATSRVRLGTSVLLAALRQPVLLAQASATVDLLSKGRLTLGIGAGGAFTPAQQAEWAHAGVDKRTRGSRLSEVVEVVQALWSGEPVSFSGRHVQLDSASIGYRPHQQPRIRTLLACHSGEGRTAQYKRAARFADGMISITDSPEDFARVHAEVRSEAEALGLRAADFDATYYITVNLNDDREAAWRESDPWVRAYYGVNFWGERWGPYGPPEAVVERARQFIEAGAAEVIFRFAARDQEGQLARFGNEVLPALK